MEEVDNQKFEFVTDKVTFAKVKLKGKKKTFVTGYISTMDMDIYNEVMTEKAMQSMLSQIMAKNIVLDYEHEAFRDDNSILPAGKIVEAKLDDRGLWVKCELNSNSPKYDALWGSIQDGFINAFSVAYKILGQTQIEKDGAVVTIIDELELLNVALTGTPVNKAAVMEEFGMKAVMLKSIGLINKSKEEINMSEEEKIPEVPKEEPKVEEPEVKPEEKPEEKIAEEPKVEEPAVAEPAPVAPAEPAEKPASEVELKALSEKMDKLLDENVSLKSDLKAIKETNVFKSPIVDEQIGMKSVKNFSMFDLVR